MCSDFVIASCRDLLIDFPGRRGLVSFAVSLFPFSPLINPPLSRLGVNCMDTAWARILCRLLVALMIWTPYQFATAGMIGTDKVVTSSAQADRTTVLNYLTRGDVQNQLQAMGVNASTAKDRVAAMSDQEVSSLAGRINSMPAGAMSDAAAVLLIIVIAAAVWWFWRR